MDLIGRANHSDSYFYKKTIRIDIKRGQTADSIENLKVRWGWSRGKVSRFLNLLETEGMIVQQRGNLTTVTTICNYDEYQLNDNGVDKADSKADDKSGGKADGGATVRRTEGQRATSKKNKKEPDKNKKEYPENSAAFRVSNFLLQHILKNKPDFRKPNLQSWSADADKMLSLDNRSLEVIKQVIAWCQADDFERANVLSIKKLRKRFDALEMKMRKPKTPRDGERKKERSLRELKEAATFHPDGRITLKD